METKILDSWSLVDFAKANGKMAIGNCTNHETGEVFKACSFRNGDNIVFASFSSKLGELNANQIVSQKDDLQVVRLESGNYKICKKGTSTWEEITL